MDDADRADQEVERMRQEALRHRKHDHLPRIGRCHNCGRKCDEGTPGRLFCDSDCQSDYEKRAAARARGGR